MCWKYAFRAFLPGYRRNLKGYGLLGYACGTDFDAFVYPVLRAPILRLRESRVRVPYPKRIRALDIGQHSWECGQRGYSVARLRRAFRDFAAASAQRLFTNYSSRFFLVEKSNPAYS